MNNDTHPASFRDPSGFVFFQNGSLCRQVNATCKEDYDRLMGSGLYASLTAKGLLVSHEEIPLPSGHGPEAYKCLRPEQIPFVSYPYEWCFSQLKDAALATLEIQEEALAFGMSLKDSSAYNIQFLRGKCVLIDTLSFETCREGQPWVAYRQFCQHFLAPLALMSLTDVRLNQLSRIHIDGVPLDLARSLLPVKAWLRLPLFMHINLHARSQKHFADKPASNAAMRMTRLSLLALVDSLKSAVRSLHWEPRGTEWGDYYDTFGVQEKKKEIVAGFLDAARPGTVWDIGGNTGVFSRVAAARGIPTVSFDIDPAAIEKSYRERREHGETNLLPLMLDLTNPSPGIGWGNHERMSLAERGPADAVLCLALLHHLAISNNVPFDRIASFLSGICRFLIIEFVPKTDPQVQKLLASREDIFTRYTQNDFENDFAAYFSIAASRTVEETGRTLYLLKNRRTL